MTAPWRRRCECGHIQGDHRSSGAGWPHPPVYGLCSAPGCDCQRFTEKPAPEPPEQVAA